MVPVLLLPWCQRKYRDPAFSVIHGGISNPQYRTRGEHATFTPPIDVVQIKKKYRLLQIMSMRQALYKNASMIR
jgi:hypothetical protein